MAHNIGKTISALRKSKGWTQAQLAEMLNVTVKAVSKWELGNGTPSVDMFPLLAETFSVTCDYLLTGIKNENITSELQLCVKNGNIDRAVKLIDEKDDKGKSVFDYAIEYGNSEMAKRLLKSYRNIFELVERNDETAYCNMLTRLLPLEVERTFVNVYFGRYYRSYSSHDYYNRASYSFPPCELNNFRATLSYSEFINELIERYDVLSQESREYYFGNDKSVGWIYAYPKYIVLAYKKGKKELFKKLINTYAGFNRNSDVNIDSLADLYFAVFEQDKETGDLILPLFKNRLGCWDEKCMTGEVMKCYRKFGRSVGDELNEIFCTRITEDVIYGLLIDGDANRTAAQKAEDKCVYRGILWLKKALQSDDVKLLGKLFKKYPLTLTEMLEKNIKAKDYKYIYAYAVDNGLSKVADACIEACCIDELVRVPDLYNSYDDNEVNEGLCSCALDVYNCLSKEYTELSDELLKQVLKSNADILGAYGKEYDLKNNTDKTPYSCYSSVRRYQGVASCLDGANKSVPVAERLDKSLEELKTFLNGYRESKLNKLTQLKEAENVKTDLKQLDELNRDYFESERDRENYEIVIIKLCKRLESYFKYVLKYEGTLYEMMDRYCSEVCGENSSTASNLNKLRTLRNGIAHSDSNSQTVNAAQINGYIELVFDVTEEEDQDE
ncbi:MAG: helix-turn-helix domain-containing protein [Corallococcus sp.]|nr:helix-turn-helix domain-containing protein [Corallococcus sp.]